MIETRWCPRCRAQTVGHDGACTCGSTKWAKNPVRHFRDTPPPAQAGTTAGRADRPARR